MLELEQCLAALLLDMLGKLNQFQLLLLRMNLHLIGYTCRSKAANFKKKQKNVSAYPTVIRLDLGVKLFKCFEP